MTRAVSDQQRLLEALQDRKPHTSAELHALDIHLVLALDELRRQGYRIREWGEWTRRFGRPERTTFFLLTGSPLEAGFAAPEAPQASPLANPALSGNAAGLTADAAAAFPLTTTRTAA